jgi:hypothetical protein
MSPEKYIIESYTGQSLKKYIRIGLFLSEPWYCLKAKSVRPGDLVFGGKYFTVDEGYFWVHPLDAITHFECSNKRMDMWMNGVWSIRKKPWFGHPYGAYEHAGCILSERPVKS